jgi:hypothetical protein
VVETRGAGYQRYNLIYFRQYLCSENTVQGLVIFSLFGDNLKGLVSSGLDKVKLSTIGILQGVYKVEKV